MRQCNKNIRTKIYIDSLGNASDGTNMWDWSNDQLTELLNTCWHEKLADLAKKILKQRKREPIDTDKL